MIYQKTLKYIFVMSFAITIIYPLVNIYIIFPSFQQLLINDTEEDAIRVANHLASMVVSETNKLNDPDEFKNVTEEAKEDFRLEKIKIFSHRGKVLFSTDPEDIGKINMKPYFYEVVARGKPYSQLVQKGTKTLEDRTVDVDVMETYVPIMSGPDFLGAFEIYYDVTARNNSINNTAFHASIISFVLVFIFFVLTIFVLFKTGKRPADLQIGRLSGIYQSPFHLMVAVFLVIFIAESLIMFFLTIISPKSDMIKGILDSAMLVMMLSPFLYFFILRPLTLHINQRREAEDEVREAYYDLEGRIEERTSELTEKNRELEKEIYERRRVEKDREKLIAELKEAIAKVKTLKGLLPVCSSCNKIRDEKGNWTHVDVYIRDHSEAEITHGYCPECEKKHFPENFDK